MRLILYGLMRFYTNFPYTETDRCVFVCTFTEQARISISINSAAKLQMYFKLPYKCTNIQYQLMFKGHFLYNFIYVF